MIDYIGDLSRADAALLRVLASRSQHILEFGAGASTQIFAAYGTNPVHTVETDWVWREKTSSNLRKLVAAQQPVLFHEHWKHLLLMPTYDLIFVDGPDEMRFDFATDTWPLTVGGVVCFHDTRRTKPHGNAETSDIENALIVAARFSPEIDRIVLNQAESNITVITKRAPLLLEDWNVVEGRTDAQIGIA